ncbi:hypothetical protein K1T71_009749 [Dendrolimus kikuchii]|uniref:Uncharacterized protein n=1 Tax=Dendrolimus kikuchii TaxID=765133 RepID=A0ACC1CSQ9_9NEOP|nr:hypothetical protein K1T71_009749 [Dendrolimus kikuchii]
MIGDDKLLRLGGRIRAADVDQNVKTPVLLDGSHPVARLLVYRFHVKMGHANHETVVNELRQHYWILRLRSTVRTVAHRCLFCKIRKSLPQAPPTGNLPQERMAHHKRCFTFTGLDYFGPVSVTIGRRREKRYVALFTYSAIACIRRFIARRGAPDTFFSDNGTAFVGANKILREFYSNGVEDFAANNGVKWHFIPPAAPNFGGCWERLVRSIKVALNATLKNRSPKEETLLTLLSEAEAVVNSRPLTHVSVHADDQETLTPFHFLIGSSSTTALPATLTDNVLVGRTEWKKALRLSDFFWSRWVKEVLPTMQPRQRPYQSLASQIACGDLVLIADSNLPRGVWPRGRITATYPGRDNVVRVVDVSTAAGTLRRPLNKLVKLNVN